MATVQPSYANDVFRRVGWIVQPQRSGQPQIPIVLSVKVPPMVTLLRRSNRSSKVPQAASSLAGPPEPPAEQAAAKDRLVHGSAGRHQLATLPSSRHSVEPPLTAPRATKVRTKFACYMWEGYRQVRT